MDITAYQHMRISTRGKRPLRNLTPGDKVRAIQRIHNGETKASVSRDIGVPESTLRGWCKNEQKLRFMCHQLGAAIVDQGMTMNTFDNLPEKRPKVVETFEFDKSFGYDRFEFFNSSNRLPASSSNSENKNNCFRKSNVLGDVFKKNTTTKDEGDRQIFSDNPFVQGGNALSTPINYSQLPNNQNMNLFSLLNPNLTVCAKNAGKKSVDISENTPLGVSVLQKDMKNKSEKQPEKSSIKSWAHESLSSPLECINLKPNSVMEDATNDSNNNIRPMISLPPADSGTNFPLSSNFFPTNMPLPRITSLTTEAKSDVLLQWSKVFNASLSFLALATAVAAIQCPESVSSSISSSMEQKSAIPSESFHILNSLPENTQSYTPPVFEPSEDSNSESEPEDLSIRSGTSKVSSSANSRRQSPVRDIMSDSVILSDDEH